DVRPHRGRIVERAGADEAELRSRVLAVHRDLAVRAAEDPLHAAVVARDVDRLRLVGEKLHAFGLDEQVDDERATCLPLAVQAVAAVHEETLGRQPVPDRSAGATAFAGRAHAQTLADVPVPVYA